MQKEVSVENSLKIWLMFWCVLAIPGLSFAANYQNTSEGQAFVSSMVEDFGFEAGRVETC